MEDVILKDVEIIIIIVFDGILIINGDGFYLLNYVDLNFIVRYLYFVCYVINKY